MQAQAVKEAPDKTDREQDVEIEIDDDDVVAVAVPGKRGDDHENHAAHTIVGVQIRKNQEDEDEAGIKVTMHVRMECDGRVYIHCQDFISAIRAMQYQRRNLADTAMMFEELLDGIFRSSPGSVGQPPPGLLEAIRKMRSGGDDDHKVGQYL